MRREAEKLVALVFQQKTAEWPLLQLNLRQHFATAERSYRDTICLMSSLIEVWDVFLVDGRSTARTAGDGLLSHWSLNKYWSARAS